MNGSVKLSSEEKNELVEDAMNINRGKVFGAARVKASEGGLDDFINFLSQNMEWVNVVATERITANFKL
jgi:hypothetical protein